MSFLSPVTEGNDRDIFYLIVLFNFFFDWFWIEAGNPNIEAGIDLRNSLHRVVQRIMISSAMFSNHRNLKTCARQICDFFFLQICTHKL